MPDPTDRPTDRPTDWLRPSHPVRTPVETLAGWLGVAPPGAFPGGAAEVTGLSLSSLRVRRGDLYAALPGQRVHGASYAADAVAAGAVAVLTDPAGRNVIGATTVPVLSVDDPRGVLGDLAAKVYGEPARSLALVGVTGTQGKTTVTRLAEAALTREGVSAAVVGTVGTRIAGTEVRTALTTPEAPDLQALFAVMREHAVRACAMEVSSHALVMGRVDGVVFDVACFTNLGRDHLDFHHTVEEYFAAKASMFTPARTRAGLVNVDDPWGRRLVGEARARGVPVTTYGLREPADWRAVDVELAPDGADLTVRGPDGCELRTRVPLPGEFNVSNALCAIAGAATVGLDPGLVARGIAAGGGVAGRLERVEAGQGWLAVVDYAHKPDAVTAALTALRAVTEGRLIVVIGAGGDRDTGKRPLMGEIAARLADVLVVTDDNPRSEDPAAIRAAVLAGVPADTAAEVHEVDRRRAAIGLAVDLAGPGDTVLVAGKGHETGQEVAGTVHPFDDRVVLRELIEGGLSEDAP